MSGLAAMHDCDGGPVDVDEFEDLLDAIAWRGPDGRGRWCAGPTALGAALHWTTPEDVGSTQPVVALDDATALVFDGRLDNRTELVDTLGIRHADECSDADLVSAAYEAWGGEFVERICGPFAVVVWDRRRGQLLLARDPLGQRPLFHRTVNGTVYVASTIDALRHVHRTAATLNEDYLWDFVTTNAVMGSLDPCATPFREISRLPAGHVLTQRGRSASLHRYWRPWDLPPLEGSDGELIERFRDEFERVIAATTRTIGPPVATLSGGLDSSSIVCLARTLESARGAPLHTVSTVWSPRGARIGYDERPFVDAVIAMHPGPTHFVDGDTLTGPDYFGDDDTPADEPFAQFSQQWRALTRTAADAGGAVLLAGFGGDHLLQGNAYYLADLLRGRRFGELARAIRGHNRRGGTSYPLLLGWYALAPMLPRPAADVVCRAVTRPADRLAMQSVGQWSPPAWVHPRGREHVRRAGQGVRLERRFRSYARQHDYEMLVAATQDCGQQWLRNVGLSGGVDVRLPFLDRGLTELCLRLPNHLKFHGGVTKVVLRAALHDVLPPELAARRDKTSYDFHAVDDVKRSWPLIAAAFDDPVSERLGFVDGAACREVLQRVRQGGGGLSQTSDVLTILSLEQWLRRVTTPVPERRDLATTAGSNNHQQKGMHR